MTKKQIREAVYNMYGGLCAYCGETLEKKWHIDHLVSLIRDPKTGKPYRPDLDNIDNMMPSCVRCNSWKHSMPLEAFRQCIEKLVPNLLAWSPQYRMALKYGMVKETTKPVVFYFEKENHDDNAPM